MSKQQLLTEVSKQHQLSRPTFFYYHQQKRYESYYHKSHHYKQHHSNQLNDLSLL